MGVSLLALKAIKLAATNTTTPWYLQPAKIAGLTIPMWMLLVVVLVGGFALGFLVRKGKIGRVARY